MRGSLAVLVGLVAFLFVAVPCMSGEAAAGAAEPAPAPSEGPPLPLQTIEGVGGGAFVPMAYLVNPPTTGALGKPSITDWYAGLDHKALNVFAITETVRVADTLDLELSYAYGNLNLGHFPEALEDAGLPDIGTSHVGLQTFSVRTPLWKEGAFDQAWMPAVTLGASWKNNDEISTINRKLGGALRGLGMRRDDGLEFTLSATKAFPGIAGRPTIVTVGGRLSEANQAGYLGFTDTYKPLLEASALCLVTDNLGVVAEYRMKPDQLGRVPGLVEDEDDWFDLGLVYVVNEHLTLTGAYAYFGDVLDEDVNGGFALGVKYEF